MNLSLIFVDVDDRERAIACLLRALGQKHDHADGHLALAQNLLAMGDFAPGWLEYEWRNETEAGKNTMPKMTSAHWNGMPIPKGRILLVGDQGYGDTIQFARYIPMVAERCEEVVLGCSAEMGPILQNIPGVKQFCHRWNDVPGHAAHCRLSSLPYLFQTTWTTIPAQVPYLKADPARVAAWRERFAAQLPPGRRIGLAWTGRPTHPNDRRRSLPLARLRPIAGGRPGRRVRLAAEADAGRRSAADAAVSRHDRPVRRPDGFRRDRRGDRKPRHGRHGGHLHGASGRRAGQAGLDHAAQGGGLALDARPQRQPLVPDGAAVPPARSGRLGRGARRGRPRAGQGAAAPRRWAPPRTDPDAGPKMDTQEQDLAAQAAELGISGLFDAAWYLHAYPDVGQAGLDPLVHFVWYGWQERRKPNPYFDPAWYLASYPDVAAAAMNPLLHYLRHGDLEGRRPMPYFDPDWYRTAHGLAPDRLALRHFLPRRGTGRFRPCAALYAVPFLPPYRGYAATQRRPVPRLSRRHGAQQQDVFPDLPLLAASGLVDADYYLINGSDVHEAALDPVLHFCRFGWQEKRKPNIYFDTGWYLATNPRVARLRAEPAGALRVRGGGGEPPAGAVFRSGLVPGDLSASRRTKARWRITWRIGAARRSARRRCSTWLGMWRGMRRRWARIATRSPISCRPARRATSIRRRGSTPRITGGGISGQALLAAPTSPRATTR